MRMVKRMWAPAVRLKALALALSSTALMAGCGDAATVTAEAFPPSIVLGEGAVTLKGETGSNSAFADYEWRMIKRPAGSEVAFEPAMSAEASFTPDVVGEYAFRFTATVGSTRSGGGLASGIGGRTAISSQVTVTAVPRPAGKLAFVVQPSKSVAGASFQPPVSVELRGDDGQKLSEAIGIALTVSGGTADAQFVGTTTATTVDGVATFSELGIDLVGQGYTLKASAAGITSATSDAFDVVAGTPDGSKSTFVAMPSKVAANGVDVIDLQLDVRDAFGNAVADVSVAFASEGDSIFPASTGKTDEAGVFAAQLSSTRAGFRTVKASFRDEQLSADVQFEAGAAAKERSSINVNPPEATPDGVSTVEIVVTATDAFDNPVVGEQVVLTVSGSGNALSPVGAQSTDEQGVTVFELASTVAELKTITASLAGFEIQSQAKFTTLLVDKAKSTITVAPYQVVADDSTEQTVSVKLVDANNNPVAGVSVDFSSAAAQDVFLPAGPIDTDVAGVAMVRVKSTLAGVRPVRASFGAQSLEANLVFVPGVADREQSSFVPSPASLTADGVSVSTLTLTLKDRFGNVRGSEPVTFEVNGTGNVLVGATGSTDVAGKRTATLKSSVAGEKVVTATFGLPVQNWQVNVTFVAQVPTAAQSDFTATSSVVADGVSKSTLVATLRDANGHPVPGVKVSFAAPDEGDVLSAGNATTAADGKASVTMTSTKAGRKTLSASWAGQPAKTTDVTFIAGAASKETSTLTASPGTRVPVSDKPNLTMTVRVLDAFGNPIKGVDVEFVEAGSKVTSDESGLSKLEMSSTVAGSKTVTAKIAGFTISETVEFEPGAASKGTLTRDYAERVADDSSSSKLSMKLEDKFGNVVPGVTVTFSSNGTLNTITPATAQTGSDGVAGATIRSRKAETKTVSAKVGTSIVETTSIVFVSGAPDNEQSTFTATPNSVVADGTTSQLRLVVKDSFGNLVSGETVSLSVTGITVNLSTATVVTNASGVATATVSSTAAGNVSVRASSARGLDKTASVNFTSPARPPEVVELTLAYEAGACAQVAFTLLGNESGRVALRYEYQGPDGALKTATPAGSLPARNTFVWDIAKDLRGSNMTSVKFVVTPSLDGIDGGAGETVLTGLSFGLFGPLVTLDGVPGITGLSAGYINADGHLDLLAAASTPNRFVVHHGAGDYGWVKDDRLSELAGRPVRHESVDLNGDGVGDLVVAYAGEGVDNGRLEIRMSDEKGVPITSSYRNVNIEAFTVVDINGDGRLDVVAVGSTSDGAVVAIAEQLASGFSEQLRFIEPPVKTVYTGVAVGDLNGDGVADIVVTVHDGAIRVATGLSRGAFASLVTTVGVSTDIHSPVLVDRSGKGWSDVIVASAKSQNIVIFKNDLDSGFRASVLVSESGSQPLGLTGGDFTGNGHRDVLVTLADGTVHLLQNDGTILDLVDSVAFVGSGPVSVVADDFNDDGLLDFATANAGSGTISVVYNTSYAECR